MSLLKIPPGMPAPGTEEDRGGQRGAQDDRGTEGKREVDLKGEGGLAEGVGKEGDVDCSS
jgi:hypothetical protein